jgi:hypothetical protein
MKYLWKAFTARPFGMPIPPNFFGLALFGLLGAYMSPGFLALGLGLEIAYLAGLAYNPRFRKAVDASELPPPDPAESRYNILLGKLDRFQQERQQGIEARVREIFVRLGDAPLFQTHKNNLEQLVWIHLKLLAARQSIVLVVQTAVSESQKLGDQKADIDDRLGDKQLAEDLRRSLEQQKEVIEQRQQAHTSAAQRLEHVDAELARIEQQIALIREQALLSTDEEQVGASLDALTASFNEANRWLHDQSDLLDVFEMTASQPLPASVLQREPGQAARKRVLE